MFDPELENRVRALKSSIPENQREEFISVVVELAESLGWKMAQEILAERKSVMDGNLRTLLR